MNDVEIVGVEDASFRGQSQPEFSLIRTEGGLQLTHYRGEIIDEIPQAELNADEANDRLQEASKEAH